MSKYWNYMQLFKKKNANNSLFVSTERPKFLKTKKYELITSSKTYFEDYINEITNFYFFNYNVDNGTSYTEIDIKKYLNLDSEILAIKDEKIIGCIISLLIPINIITELDKIDIKYTERFNFFNSEKSLIFGCTSFLAVERKYRKKGFGMSLIQESLQILFENGGLAAYFINSVSRGDNSIKLNIWYFPLNIQKLNNSNYSYHKNYKYEIIDYPVTIKKVDEDLYEIAFNFYKSCVENKIFAFAPSFLYWKKWVNCFPTYLIFEKEEIVGLFSFNSNNVRYPINKITLLKGSILLCVGKQPETLQCALKVAKDLYDILEIYETGDLSVELLSSTCLKYNKHKYINFFNTQLQINASDFYAPIF